MNTLEKIVNSSKLPVLFIGSGISKDIYIIILHGKIY